jgi:transposase
VSQHHRGLVLDGIGDNFAAVLGREVFDHRFANRKQLASYVGLTPMPHRSGNMDKDRSIGRAANGRARKTLVQAA